MRYEHIGDRIRYLRELKGIKQKDIAKKFHVEENTWSQYETYSRKPSIDIIKGVANYFEVSADYLIGLTDEFYNSNDKNIIELLKKYTSLDNETKNEFMKYIRNFGYEVK